MFSTNLVLSAEETMCGICGFITNKNLTINQLDCMNKLMSYREPNDSGSVIYKVKEISKI